MFIFHKYAQKYLTFNSSEIAYIYLYQLQTKLKMQLKLQFSTCKNSIAITRSQYLIS